MKNRMAKMMIITTTTISITDLIRDLLKRRDVTPYSRAEHSPAAKTRQSVLPPAGCRISFDVAVHINRRISGRDQFPTLSSK